MSWIWAVKAATAASCLSFSGDAALPQFENELTCVREFFVFFFYDDSVGRRDDLIHALRLTRHLWYSIMARALSIFLRGSTR